MIFTWSGQNHKKIELRLKEIKSEIIVFLLNVKYKSHGIYEQDIWHL